MQSETASLLTLGHSNKFDGSCLIAALRLEIKEMHFNSRIMTRKLLFLLAMVLMLSSCEGALDDIFGEWDRPTPPAVTSIMLNETKLTKMVGDDAFTLTATVNADATDKTLVWTSDKPGVASVDANGVVTIQGQGLATITVTATNGTESTADDKTATCKVAVFKTVNLAELTGDYQVKDYDILTGTLDQYTQLYKISIEAGATITLSGVDIEGNYPVGDGWNWAGLTCLGDATIILAEGTSNKVNGFQQNHPGIYVPSGKTLTILGNGSLTAASHGAGAGIGGGSGIPCGNIIINGGSINATGGDGAAGIGGGNGKACGTITINGGNITATGGTYAAGIGGSSSGDCSIITITGGTIQATGGLYGAGIGSGNRAGCGNISISGGDIIAKGIDAAGIGTGSDGKCGNISITGGTISATGGDRAAGIGGGNWGKCGNITIAKTITSVKATKGYITATNHTDPYSIGVGSDNLSNSDVTLCACGTVTFDTQSFTLTGTRGTGSEDNSWTYSPVPVSGTNYGGLTLTISGDTWTLQP